MGIVNSSMSKKKIDEATSNTGLSSLRYVITEKPKWKVFKKREAVPLYQSSVRPIKGCPCGNTGPCKQKITPRGVTIHYPQKKKKFNTFSTKSRRFLSPKTEKTYYNTNARTLPKVKIVRPRKFPTWRMDKIYYKPYYR
ncbi:uncharacterized protein LOC115455043 isoform X2 [Manduca sexta]|uniref:uncharacterized protein LOC115455043 isoform X2 n=1 Tax=Manduca sexta TaxID=7130 RepID=UPI00188ED17F|nr:uncharacterized protein LOC115455043 isoform X2 [Manduca sexta]